MSICYPSDISRDQFEQVFSRPYIPYEGKSKEEIKLWYNQPHDGHMSTKGAEMYVEVMCTLLKERLCDIVNSLPASWAKPFL